MKLHYLALLVVLRIRKVKTAAGKYTGIGEKSQRLFENIYEPLAVFTERPEKYRIKREIFS
jgi:hypothetical protein